MRKVELALDGIEWSAESKLKHLAYEGDMSLLADDFGRFKWNCLSVLSLRWARLGSV